MQELNFEISKYSHMRPIWIVQIGCANVYIDDFLAQANYKVRVFNEKCSIFHREFNLQAALFHTIAAMA